MQTFLQESYVLFVGFFIFPPLMSEFGWASHHLHCPGGCTQPSFLPDAKVSPPMAARGDGWKRRLLPNDEYMRLPCLFKPLGPRHHSSSFRRTSMSNKWCEIVTINTANLQGNHDAFSQSTKSKPNPRSFFWLGKFSSIDLAMALGHNTSQKLELVVKRLHHLKAPKARAQCFGFWAYDFLHVETPETC